MYLQAAAESRTEIREAMREGELSSHPLVKAAEQVKPTLYVRMRDCFAERLVRP